MAPSGWRRQQLIAVAAGAIITSLMQPDPGKRSWAAPALVAIRWRVTIKALRLQGRPGTALRRPAVRSSDPDSSPAGRTGPLKRVAL